MDDNATSSIGRAEMDADGTIRLFLRAEFADGTIGDGILIYPPDHNDYAQILSHLGGLKPGESCPVKPFPEAP